MSWQQLKCRTEKQYETRINTLFEEYGAVSVTYQDAEDVPVLEPLPGETPLWDDLIITGLFEADTDIQPLLKDLQKRYPAIQLELETLQDQPWERAWMDDYHPMQFGQRLWIYPTHFERPDDGSTQILLDPGLAFGTGTHPTTALCLEWLDENPPLGKSMIDYGCGSGILAIAAIKLGATHAVATDIDEQAFIATKSNMQINGIADNLIETCFPKDIPTDQVDLLMANILSGPLTELAPKLHALIKPKGEIVLSGILTEQKEDIMNAYSGLFHNLQVAVSDDWIRVTGTRPSSGKKLA